MKKQRDPHWALFAIVYTLMVIALLLIIGIALEFLSRLFGIH